MSRLSAAGSLRRIAERLMRPRQSSVARTAAAQELRSLLSDLAETNVDEETQPLHLSSGIAIAPRDAAHCLDDGTRTSAFLIALQAALADAQRRFSGVLQVVYAGTGPFAPLAVPLLPFLRDEVRFTFIDAFASSAKAVRRVLQRLGFERFARAVVTGDAASYRHPSGIPLHIAITETMQRSLAREPQVPIVRNLAAQLSAGGLLVPRRVAVDLVFGTAGPEGPVVLRRAGCAFELTATTALAPLDANGCLPPRFVTTPAGVETMHAMYATRIQAYGSTSLRQNRSGLTTPEVLWTFGEPRAGQRYAFRYRLGPSPQLLWELCTR